MIQCVPITTMAISELTNGQARQALNHILDSPEFANATIWDKIKAYINHHSAGSAQGSSLLSETDILHAKEAFFVLAGIIVLSYIIWRTLPVWKVMAGEARSKEVADSVSIQPTAVSLLTEADKKASNGDFRLALRDIYLSLLLEMDHRRIVTYAVATTNSEYLREIEGKAAGLKASFQAIVNLFEDKWYGLQACAREDFQKGRELYMVLLKENPHG